MRLADYRQFVLVKFVPLADGRTDKIPCSLAHVGVDAHDARNWLDRDTALAAATQRGPEFGIGFVLTPADPFVCLDIDAALLQSGQWDSRVHEAGALLPGAAWGVSRSGRGVHGWMAGARLLPPHRVIKNTAQHMELYDAHRFIALGPGELAVLDRPLQECAALPGYAARYFPAKQAAAVTVDDGPREGWHGPTDDDALIARGRALKQSMAHAMGTAAHFSDLWDGNVDVLARVYPGTTTPYDGSSVDLAMCNALAYLTGCDGPRMDRLLRRWVLFRDKWNRDDYRDMTLAASCPPGRAILQDKPTAAEAVGETPEEPTDTSGTSPFLDTAAQLKLFAGCVYVLSVNEILTTTGDLLNEARFNSWHGQHRFCMDQQNTKISNKAWEAFTRSTCIAWPRAHDMFYDPRQPFGTLRRVDDRLEVNAYRAPNVVRTPGDIAPFMKLLQLMLPDPPDRLALLTWAKRLVQSPGYKFSWACVLQGAEGNGKSLLAKCLEYAVGLKVTARPKAADLTGQFNKWAEGAVLCIAEDLHKSRDGSDILEGLKSMLTETRQSVEAKGVDSRVASVFWNLLITTNHQGALRKSRNDRRLAMFFCAQQTAEDVAAMNFDFPAYGRWLEAGGYAAIAHWLATDAIDPEFDPLGKCIRAPKTSAEQAAIDAGKDSTQTAIQEAIEEARPGFRGDFVSSVHLAALIDERRAGHIWPQQRRGELMASMGYSHHQALPDGGRISSMVPGPQGFSVRPRLYVRRFSEAALLPDAAAVTAAYLAAQN
jgi:hypothetical protein